MSMRLNITPNRLISEVQKEFNTKFPFLKLEFYQNKGYDQPDFSAKKMLPHNRKIGDAQSAITDGEIVVRSDMKVKDLERALKEQFCLAVQVFRRSGNLWLQTSMTDSWTLEHQNSHGREITGEPTRKPMTDNMDYDLTRDADH
jgi:hypothetical protein